MSTQLTGQPVINRLAKSLGAQTLSQIMNMAIQIFSVPIFLHYLGINRYGEWLLLSTIPTYLTMSDLGFANAAGNEMTMFVSRGERNMAVKVYQSAWAIVTITTFVLCLIMILILSHIYLSKYLNIKAFSDNESSWILSILIAQVFFALQSSLLVTIYRCDGNYSLSVLRSAFQKLAMFIGIIVCLISGIGLLGGCTTSLVIEIITNQIIRYDIKSRSPWMTFGWAEADVSTALRLANPAFAYLTLPLGWALNLQGMSFLVGTLLGPSALVVFSTLRTLSRLPFQITNSISNSIWVEMSVAFGKGDIRLARTLHNHACQISLWLVLIAVSFLFLSGKIIYTIWT